MKQRSIYLSPAALREIDQLPGHIRQRVRRAIIGLRSDPFPPDSKQLTIKLTGNRESWRLRIERWRIVYVIDFDNEQVFVAAVRQRPPYQYEDLDILLTDIS